MTITEYGTQFSSGVLISDVNQLGQNTNNTYVNDSVVSAALEINSTEGALLIPRMSTAERDALETVTPGMIVFNTTEEQFDFLLSTGPNNWVELSNSTGNVSFDGAAATDNAIAIFSGTTGLLIQDSGVLINANVPGPLARSGVSASSTISLSGLDYLGFTGANTSQPAIYVGTLSPLNFSETDNQVNTVFTGGIPGSSSSVSALLELQSTSGCLLISRMTQSDINELTPSNGMLVYNTDNDEFLMYQAGAWENIGNGSGTGGSVTSVATGANLTGGPITTTGTIALKTDLTGIDSIDFGDFYIENNQMVTTEASGFFFVTPSLNVYSGNTTAVPLRLLGTGGTFYSGIKAPDTLTTSTVWSLPASDGNSGQLLTTDGATNLGWSSYLFEDESNLFLGTGSGSSITTAENNTGVGIETLSETTTGYNNASIGCGALKYNTTGYENTAVGYSALSANTTGSSNTACGDESLTSNTTGYLNAAIGYSALFSNTTGNQNTAVGSISLGLNTVGSKNTAVGYSALSANTTGYDNTAVGYGALFANTTGNYNTGLGYSALLGNIGDYNIGIGYSANENSSGFTTSNCIFIGSLSSATASVSNAIAIGYGATVSSSNAMVLGNGVNVGIGTSTPLYPLHISNVSNYATLYLDATTSTPSIPSTGGLLYTSGGELYYKGNAKTVQLSASSSITTTQYDVLVGGASNTIVSVGPGTSGQLFQSKGSSTNPAYTTAIYPSTTTVNQLLYSSATNTISGLSTANSSILATNASGVPALTTTLPFTVPVSTGGTGLSSTTAYGLIAGGTTSTGALQNAGTGTANQVYISGGPSALGSWVGRLFDNGSNFVIGTSAGMSFTLAVKNTVVGVDALHSNTSGSYQIALGNGALYSNTSGQGCSALGYQALYSNTTGSDNIGIGYQALYSNTTSSYQIALGTSALYSNTTGSDNIGIGYQALNHNTGGSDNIGIGSQSLYTNAGGDRNIALGYQALYSNTGGNNNTALGYQALMNSDTSSANTAVGYQASSANISGTYNTAVGYQALYTDTVDDSNTAIGYQALYASSTGSSNVAIGYNAMKTGGSHTQSIAIGASTTIYTNTTNAIAIGYGATVLSSNAMVLGSGVNVGIGTSTPLARLHVVGGQIINRTSTDVNYTVSLTDYVIAVTSTSASRTITLPSTRYTGQVFIVKDETGGANTNNIIVSGNSVNIDGSATATINTSYGSISVYYNGTSWSKF